MLRKTIRNDNDDVDNSRRRDRSDIDWEPGRNRICLFNGTCAQYLDHGYVHKEGRSGTSMPDIFSM